MSNWLKKHLLLICLLLSLAIHLFAIGAGSIWDRDRPSPSAGIIEFDYYRMKRMGEDIDQASLDSFEKKTVEKEIPPEDEINELPPVEETLSTSLLSRVSPSEEEVFSLPDELFSLPPPTRQELLNDYIIQLGRQIDAQISYPDLAARMALEGSVVVAFTLNRKGELLSLSIPLGGESRFDSFNQEALRAVHRAARHFSAFTDALAGEAIIFRLPVSFSLH